MQREAYGISSRGPQGRPGGAAGGASATAHGRGQDEAEGYAPRDQGSPAGVEMIGDAGALAVISIQGDMHGAVGAGGDGSVGSDQGADDAANVCDRGGNGGRR